MGVVTKLLPNRHSLRIICSDASSEHSCNHGYLPRGNRVRNVGRVPPPWKTGFLRRKLHDARGYGPSTCQYPWYILMMHSSIDLRVSIFTDLEWLDGVSRWSSVEIAGPIRFYSSPSAPAVWQWPLGLFWSLAKDARFTHDWLRHMESFWSDIVHGAPPTRPLPWLPIWSARA